MVDRTFTSSHDWKNVATVVAYVGRCGIANHTSGYISDKTCVCHGIEGKEATVRTGFGTLSLVPEAGDEAHEVPCKNGPQTDHTLERKFVIYKHYTDSRVVN